MHNQFSWDVFKKYFTQMLTHQNSEILRYFKVSKSFWIAFLYWTTNKDLPLKEAFLRFSHWEQSDASLLAVSVAKIVYLIHQNALVPYGKKKWWNGRKSLGTLIQNTYVSFHTFVADLCKNMISSGIYFQGLIWKFCFGKKFWSTNTGGAGVKPLLGSTNIVLCQG